MPAAKPSLKVRVRIHVDDEIALGPGKAELLAAIAEAGSISAAGRKLGMSYRRAWLLADTMNRCFREPLVIAATGGKRGGGATLSPMGEQVLAQYRAMQKDVERAAAPHFAVLKKSLRPSS
ncbi:MAG: winged helix-turn-helix domain-containing protein [Pseudomonadota bacterium]